MFDGASVVADGDGTVHPAAAAFVDQWLVVDYAAGERSFTPVVWVDDGDESMDALAWRAVVRGLKDYCGKNGFRKVWLGLSGGIDSALVLAMAVDALGARTSPQCACRRATPPGCRTIWPKNNAARWA